MPKCFAAGCGHGSPTRVPKTRPMAGIPTIRKKMPRQIVHLIPNKLIQNGKIKLPRETDANSDA